PPALTRLRQTRASASHKPEPQSTRPGAPLLSPQRPVRPTASLFALLTRRPSDLSRTPRSMDFISPPEDHHVHEPTDPQRSRIMHIAARRATPAAAVLLALSLAP